jgi:hypothetical protein
MSEMLAVCMDVVFVLISVVQLQLEAVICVYKLQREKAMPSLFDYSCFNTLSTHMAMQAI